MQVNPIIFKVIIITLLTSWASLLVIFIVAFTADKIKKYKIARYWYSMVYLAVPFKFIENKIYYCCDKLNSNSINSKTCLSPETCKCWSCPKYSTYLKLKKRSK